MEKCTPVDNNAATTIRGGGLIEDAEAHGRYHFTCRDAEGNIVWEDDIENVVCTAGKNLALDTIFAGSAYTANVFMGLISSVSYGAGPVVGDTMASHAGWYEVSATTYFPTVAARLAPGWSAASSGSKATTATAFSIITNGGTVKGCFIVYGTGAVSTLGSTAGTLYSAGTFSGGDKVVSAGDTLAVTYTASM